MSFHNHDWTFDLPLICSGPHLHTEARHKNPAQPKWWQESPAFPFYPAVFYAWLIAGEAGEWQKRGQIRAPVNTDVLEILPQSNSKDLLFPPPPLAFTFYFKICAFYSGRPWALEKPMHVIRECSHFVSWHSLRLLWWQNVIFSLRHMRMRQKKVDTQCIIR